MVIIRPAGCSFGITILMHSSSCVYSTVHLVVRLTLLMGYYTTHNFLECLFTTCALFAKCYSHSTATINMEGIVLLETSATFSI
jgi:hypothetical protein